MQIVQWNQVETEQMSPLLSRQVLHTEGLTIARIHLAKGCTVPRHQHVNEQITTVERGRLSFRFDSGETIVEAGQSVAISPNEAHEVHALEDTVAVDVFAPTRDDWKRGDDAYLRR